MDGQEPVDPRVLRTRNDVLRTAIEILVADGWDAVTQPRVARAAGYSKATVYAHWPERADLVRDALARFGDMPHHEATGDLRTDLIGELVSFRQGMLEHRLDRVLAVLAERAPSVPELVDVRTAFVADGERPMRERLGTVLSGARLEAATVMLCGLVLDAALLHGAPPTDEVLAAAVDLVLHGIG
ncbi:MAG: hypothetical protein AVDCRST_MAG41-1538 [uncultured Corynebacteriales bacterium]|uniref:HTH tetR-type domain-containing protein n=1 Tax=uncultured Mycobacteriales bacterium TaxID=581187 RepID=A0A6J4I752_9ACTN|nr:MAG: hypothetical protein AVDCRST_MAG41-1538 [uncultured Corynebacteriales bacterium]